MVDDGDRVGQLVGLLEVLGRQQQRRAFAHEAADDVPHPEPAARVEPGRRLIHEQDPRSADQGASEVEPAAHATRIRLDDAIAGVGEVELLEELGGPLLGDARGELVEPAEHPQVLAPGEVLVDRGELAGQPDDLAELVGLFDDVEAGDRRVPRVRPEQVARILTVVVFPAPFGPSSPRTVPSATSRSTPSRARTSLLRDL